MREITRLQNDRRPHQPGQAPVDWETKIIEGIKRGISDAKTGRLVTHESAMAEIDSVIEAGGSCAHTQGLRCASLGGLRKHPRRRHPRAKQERSSVAETLGSTPLPQP
ncbi:hypothetical protein CK216_07585 [Mesorhizobium sp. WSM3876]|nr:hypothetical protein CK216_07585 [Mesorhizobium sp. WSM3876]